jgi:hypothetical protein
MNAAAAEQQVNGDRLLVNCRAKRKVFFISGVAATALPPSAMSSSHEQELIFNRNVLNVCY